MSAQTKKKRLGSHRRVANQNETPKADELHLTDSTCVAQCYIPEGNNESLSASSNPDGSHPDTQHPPSPELRLNRRKLGSRRKNKGQHIKVSVYKPREEVEENNIGNEAQCEKQEELSKESWQGTCASHDSSLYSAITPGYSCELGSPTTTNCTEDILENLIPQSENQKSDSRGMQELFRAYSATEKESGERDKDTDLLRQDGDLKGDYSMSERRVESVIPGFSTTAEITSDKNKIEHSVEKATFSLPTEPADENQNEQFALPLDSKPHDTSVMTDEQTNTKFNSTLNRRKLGSSRRNKRRHHVKDSVGESYHEAEEDVAGKMLGNEVTETTELLLLVSETDAEREEREEDTVLLRQWGFLQDSNLASESDVISDVSQRTEMQEIHVIDNSSAINDAKQNSEIRYANLKDQAGVEDVEDVTGSEAFQTIPLELQTRSQKELSQDREHDVIMSVTYDKSSNTESTSNSSPEVQILTTTTYPEAELETFIAKSENPEESHDESDTGFKMEMSHRSMEATLEGTDKSNTLQSEEVNDTHSEDTVNEVQEQEVNPTQIQKMHESDYTFESAIHDTADNSDTCTRNLEDQDEVSDTHPTETLEKSIDDPVPTQELSDSDDKQDEAPVKESNVKVLHHTNEDYHEDDAKISQTSDIERADTPLDQVNENETQAEDEIKPISEQTSYQEKERLSEMEESESSLQTETNAPSDSELQDNSVKIDEQNDTDFNPIGNRRKLGSSRRNKGRRHVKGSGAESENTKDNERLGTTELPVTIETAVQETSMEIESSNIQEISTEKNSHGQHIEPEGSVDQATVSSAKEELSTIEEENDHLSSSDVKGAQHSENAVKKVYEEEEVQPTVMQEIHLDSFSESLINDATQHFDICSANLADQEEVRGSYQSELLAKSIDDPVPAQEVSHSDDKQDELPTKESNVEVLHQINEDHHEYDTKKPLNSDIERDDTPLGQAYENEAQAEDEIKPISDQTSHQEKERLSEMEESESSLQTLQTETNAPLDSELQDNSVKIDEQNDTDFNPIGNRRKLGSSRRNKGRRHVKGSGAESYHKPAKEDMEDRGNEALQTTISLALQTRSQGDSEDDVIMSVTYDNSSNTESTSNSSPEVQILTTTTYPEAELETFIAKSENPEESHDESDTGFKMEMSHRSMKATLEGTDKSNTLQSEEVNDTHSEDTVNEVQEQEVNPTQIQKMHESDYTFESAIHDTADNSDTCTRNLEDQDEVSDTHPTETLEKSIDDPVPTQELSDSDDKQDETPVKESNVEVLHHTNEDYHEDDAKISQTSDIERADTPLDQVNENETQAEDEIKPISEQTSYQEKERLSEMEESKSSLQTETNAPSDSELQDNSVKIDEQNDTDFNPIGNRRKLGSSRRNKGRRHVKGSGAESENTKDNERLGTTELPVTIETAVQETSMEIESSIIQELSTEKNSHGQHIEPEGSVDQATVSSAKEELSTIEEENDHLSSSDVKGAQHSENAVKKVYEEEEVQPTVMQEIHLDSFSESLIHDATQHFDICSANLADQEEVRGSYQSELLAKSIDDPVPAQEVSHSDDKQDELPTKESNVEVLHQINEDHHEYDTKKPLNSDIERDDTPLGQAYENEAQAEDEIKPISDQTSHQEKERLSEMEESESSLQTLQTETNAPLDSKLQDNSVKIDEQNDTDFNPIGNRRKLGSSRRNKGRRHVKGSGAESYHKPAKEDMEDRGNEALQTTISLALQTRSQGDSEDDVIMSVTYDNSSNTESTSNSSPEVQILMTTTYPDAELETFIAKSENPEESHDESDTGFKMEMSHRSMEATLEGTDKSNTLQSEEVNDTHSEDTVNEVQEQEVNPTQIQKMHESDYTFESAIHDTADNSDTCTRNLEDQDEVSDTHPTETLEKSIDDPVPTQELSDSDDKQDETPVKESNVEVLHHTNEDYHEDDAKISQTSDIERADTPLDQVNENETQAEDEIKPISEQTSYQEKERLSEMEESKSSLQTETNAPSDSELQDNSVKIDEQNDTDFNPIGNRRKLGSSRRNKGRRHVEGSSIPETGVQETLVETMVEGKNKFDLSQTEEDSDKVKENAHVGTCDLTSNKPVIDQFGATVIHCEELPCVSFVTDKGNKEPGEHSHRQHTQPEGSADHATVSSPEEELSTNEEQNEHFHPSEVTDAQQSDDALHEEEPVKLRDSFPVEGSEIRSPLDSKTMDNSHSIKEETLSGIKPTGNRRKLGSSRQNKGRQHEPYPEHTEQVVENTWDDKEEILLGTKTARQEELKEQAGPDFKPGEKITKTTAQNIIDRGTILTTGITLNLDKNDTLKCTKDLSEEKKRHMKEPENLTPLTGYDTAQIDFDLRSDTQIRSEEASAEIATDVQGDGHVEVSRECEEPANKDHAAQEINTSNEVTHAELFSAAKSKNDTFAFDVGLEENLRENRAVDASEESGISAADACSQQDMEKRNPKDYCEILQEEVKKKKRKFGSTRKSQLNRKQEGETDNKDETIESNVDMEVDVRNLDAMEQVEELPLRPTTGVTAREDAHPLLRTVWKEQREMNELSFVYDESTSVLQSVESNMKPGPDDLVVLHTEQSASNSEEVVNPILCIHGVDIKDRNRRSKNQFLSLNTEETTQSTQKDEQSPEVIKVTQVQALISTEAASAALANLEKVESGIRGGAEEETQEPNSRNERTHNTKFSSSKGRKKLSSTRRKLPTQSKGEDLDQKQEVDHEATGTSVGDVLTVGVSGMEEKKVQLHSEDKGGDSEQRKEKVFETIGYSHIGESQLKPTDYLVEQVETENQLTLDHLPVVPSTSPKHDVMPEAAAAGRRRKMGSNRRSRGHQHFEDQTARENRVIDAQEWRDVTSLTDDIRIKTAEEHTEESLVQDKISEVDENNQKSSSYISISKATGHTRPKSEQALKWVTPVQSPQADIHIVPESQKKFSFAGADVRSKTYDVLMVGDSSVGKTSFMKRAQSGKFSLDLPASVGLDSCMWTVVVDGKPVVLQLWDTAGQERFHSITKQIFHRAQAFLLMYDITSSQTFTAVSYWANCIQEGAAENVNILLLGNKSDCAERQVKTQEGESLAKEYNFEFMECSAANGENVIQSLETVARMLSQKADTTEEIVVLHKEPPQKKRLGCC